MKLIEFGIAATIAILLCACGNQQPDPQTPPSDNQPGGMSAPNETISPSQAPGSKTRVKSTDEFVARTGSAIDAATHPGNALFADNCASCHDGRVPKAPAVVWLEMMTPDAILSSLDDGIMSQQASHLSTTEKEQITEYLTRTALDSYTPPAPPAKCESEALAFEGAPPAKQSWGHDTRRFIPAETAGMTRDDISDLKLKWAFAYPSAVRARSQPAIGWNTIFVGSQSGTVYAFDLDTGCVKWTFQTNAEVRTAIVADAETKRLYFGDILGRAYAIDAMTGEQIWRTLVDEHPNATITGSPTLGGGALFVPVSSLEVTSAADPNYACCTFRGSVSALDPATGEIKWKTHTIPEPPAQHDETSIGTAILGPSGAPVWTSPTYDPERDRVYVGSGENYSSPADENSDAVFAIDARSGKKIWQTQFTEGDAWNVGCMMGNENCPEENGPDVDLSASPLIVTLEDGRVIVVIGQKSAMTYGLDIDTGEILWERRLGHGGTQGGVHFGMATEGTTVYVPIVDMADTRDAREYDETINGSGIHAIDAASGDILWRAHADNICNGREYCDPGISAAATAIPGAVFAGHLDGRFRAYDGETGDILWSYDTTKPVETITGETASGGSMSGPGAAVADGHVVLNSGYGLYYHMPGNLLLVFATQQAGSDL
ncbi:PQQ-binding-like beta-propeller repeat protein [Hyphococcus sp.]|uniref:outer membrane protein assembly factor BamB family protein n=1 Tax=Hyphococcus sp. TaxID=2038636 RepID=UPI003CCBE404